MSKLEELIVELCPEGVEHKSLGELGHFYGGLTGKSKDDFTDGNAKFITYKNVYANPALKLDIEERVKISDGEKQRTLQYGDIVFTGSSETPKEGCLQFGVCGQTVQITNNFAPLNLIAHQGDCFLPGGHYFFATSGTRATVTLYIPTRVRGVISYYYKSFLIYRESCYRCSCFLWTRIKFIGMNIFSKNPQVLPLAVANK